MTAPLDISANLPVDGTTAMKAASVSNFAIQIVNAYNSHVTNAAQGGYGPDQHNSQHIQVPYYSISVAQVSSNTSTTLDVFLAEMTTRIHNIEGTGTDWQSGTAPITLAAINSDLTTNSTSSATAGTWAKRGTKGEISVAEMTVIGSSATVLDDTFRVQGANGQTGTAYLGRFEDYGQTHFWDVDVTGNTNQTGTFSVNGTLVIDATGKIAPASLGSAIGPGSLASSSLKEGYIVANGTANVTVVSPGIYDATGNFTAGASHTYTMTAPSGGNQWVLLYIDPSGAFLSAASAVAATPTKPQGLSNTVPFGAVYLRSGSALVYQTDQGHDGYVSDDRTPYLLMNGPSAVSGGAAVWGVGQGGTGASTASGARANLGTAASGANSDILTMDGIQRIKGMYFATTNSLGLNQNPTANDWLAIATNTNAKRGLTVTATGTGGTAVANNILVQSNGYYDALDSTATESNLGNTPYGVGMFGYGTYLTVGSQTGTVAAAWGSVIGYQATIQVRNVGSKDNEYAPYGALVYNDNGNMTPGTPMGRLWGPDINVHGAVGQQQSALSNAHFTLGNYYNGSPFGPSVITGTFDATNDATTRNAATGVAVTAAGYNFISGNAATFLNAATYPCDIGVWVGGATGDSTAGTMARQGWRYGIVIGARAGNYGEVIPGSRIGTGLFVRDYETAAIRMWNQYTGAHAMGLIGNANSGPSVLGMQATIFNSLQFRGFLNIGDKPSDGTNWSNFFNINGGALASTLATTINLAAFSVVDPLASPSTGVAPVDTANLIVRAYRNTAAGNTYTTTSIGLGMTGPATAMLNGIWFAGNGNIGVGASNTAPSYGLDVGGSVSTIVRGALTVAGTMVYATNGNPATVIANGATIPTTTPVYNINPSAAVTGIIVDKTNATEGQVLTVVNVSVNSATMAAAATSNVASGTGCVIPGLGIKVFRYNAQGGFWYSN